MASRRLGRSVGREADERLVGEVGQGDALAGGQRVVAGQGADQLLLADDPGAYPRAGGGQADEAEVEAALGDAGERGVGVGLAGEDQLDAGVGGADGAGEQRQRLVAGGPGEADGDPAVLAAPGGLDGADGEVEVVQDGADRAEEGLAGCW